MSTAFKCDICGQCVDFAADAKAIRTVAEEIVPIFAVSTTIGIKITTDQEHVCDTCWAEIMRKVKVWAESHLS